MGVSYRQKDLGEMVSEGMEATDSSQVESSGKRLW